MRFKHHYARPGKCEYVESSGISLAVTLPQILHNTRLPAQQTTDKNNPTFGPRCEAVIGRRNACAGEHERLWINTTLCPPGSHPGAYTPRGLSVSPGRRPNRRGARTSPRFRTCVRASSQQVRDAIRASAIKLKVFVILLRVGLVPFLEILGQHHVTVVAHSLHARLLHDARNLGS